MSINRFRAVSVAAALACLLAVIGCAAGPQPQAAPVPPPAAPSKRAAKPSVKKVPPAEFARAQKTYRAFIAEYNRQAWKGGATKATPAMKRAATGPFLSYYVAALRSHKKEHDLYTTPMKIGWVRPGLYEPTQLTLEVCEYWSTARTYDQNGEIVALGDVLRRAVYLRRVDGRWKLWNGDEKGTVPSCV